MKKLLSLTITLMLISASVFNLQSSAIENNKRKNDYLWKRASYERKVFKVGNNILRANNIEKNISFSVYRSNRPANAYADVKHGNITIERSLLRYLESDDELAAILSHEIVHILYPHTTEKLAKRGIIGTIALAPFLVLDGILMAFGDIDAPIFTKTAGTAIAEKAADNTNKPYETEADLKGIDLMVKAGYDPLAMADVMTKISGDGTVKLTSHPMGRKRIDAIYNYIAQKYPEYLKEEDDTEDIVPTSNKSQNKN